MELEIVFENDFFIAVDKPPAFLTIEGRGGSKNAFPVLWEFLEKKTGKKLFVIHRLDFEVSGLVLFAKNSDSHRQACSSFENRSVHKTYEAWTDGPLPHWKSQVWTSKLLKGKKRAYESPVGKESITKAEFLGQIEFDQKSRNRFLVYPRTGRSHQIRYHLFSNGFPILGDRLYGSQSPFGENHIALRAMSLKFDQDRLLKDFGLPRELHVTKSLGDVSKTIKR
jgi:tRNA pseudouridine32 synthase/23S rRNA pseudouridine746 synthase